MQLLLFIKLFLNMANTTIVGEYFQIGLSILKI